MMIDEREISFTRKVIVGVSSFMYDIITITRIIDGKHRSIKVPFYNSFTGSHQFLQDFFIKDDKYCDELRPAKGNTMPIPYGVFTIKTSGIEINESSAQYNRAIFVENVETNYGIEHKNVSANTVFVAMKYTSDFEVICSSEIEAYIIQEKLIDTFYNQKKFSIRFAGFEALPVAMEFSKNIGIDKAIKFSRNDTKNRPMLSFSCDITAMKPIVDENTKRYLSENIQSFTLKHNDGNT